jgi:hypothetical protein
MRRKLDRISQEFEKGTPQLEHPTIFHTVLQSDLPPQEKTRDRLGDEAQLVIGAGVTTTVSDLKYGPCYETGLVCVVIFWDAS